MAELGGFFAGVVLPPEDPWPGWHYVLEAGQWVVRGPGGQLCPEPNTWQREGMGDALRRSLELNRAWTLRHDTGQPKTIPSPIERLPHHKIFAPLKDQPAPPNPNVLLG